MCSSVDGSSLDRIIVINILNLKITINNLFRLFKRFQKILSILLCLTITVNYKIGKHINMWIIQKLKLDKFIDKILVCI